MEKLGCRYNFSTLLEMICGTLDSATFTFTPIKTTVNEQELQLLQLPSQEWLLFLESLQGADFLDFPQQSFVVFSILQHDISVFSVEIVCLGKIKIPKQKTINNI